MDAGNYRLIVEPQKEPEKRNRHWLLILLELALLFPAAMVLALLIVALLRGA